MKKRRLFERIKIWLILVAVTLGLLLTYLFFVMKEYKLEQRSQYLFVFWTFVFLLFIEGVLGEKYIVRPARVLKQKMELFNEGIIFDEVFDCLCDVSENVKCLSLKIREMLDKDKRIENAKQQARYLALQNQINPHFLYNVLESIRSDALLAGIPEIGKIAEALAVFFRYTTSKMENLSTLQEELGNVENYFLIQKYRFEEKIELKIHYDAEDEMVLKLAIPKLTLQPIVENAIKHGLEPKVEGGTVTIQIEHTDQNLYISINDDGVGIDEDKLGQLNDKLERMEWGDGSAPESGKGGIALINVNTRIRLLMGEEYGMHMFSTPGIGTEVRLTLPYMFDEKKEESVDEKRSAPI